MVLMILEKVPEGLRGDLTRWLFEVKTGVYVGHVSAMVRDRLWEKCCASRRAGGVLQAWSTNNEQRFAMRMEGCKDRQVVDLEGILCIQESDKEMTKTQKRRAQGS